MARLPVDPDEASRQFDQFVDSRLAFSPANQELMRTHQHHDLVHRVLESHEDRSTWSVYCLHCQRYLFEETVIPRTSPIYDESSHG